MTSPEDALERSHQMIDEASVEARAELETADAGTRELLDQIAPTEPILGGRAAITHYERAAGLRPRGSRHET